MTKLLRRVLLVHWHFYAHQLIELDTINFLTGKTGAGKTTIIDALQVVLLGDTNARRFFNKAANEKSERTLEGYLSGEYGEDGDRLSRSLRKGRYSSYIACEFEDTRDRQHFTVGVAFDSYEVGKWSHQWFIFRDALPEHHFIKDDKVPMDIPQLRAWLRRQSKQIRPQLPASNQQFQNQLAGVLGGLRKNYFSLFRRAVAFTPIQDITSFITDYICDADRSIDIHELKENLRHYRRLEIQAAQIKAQVDHLQKEVGLYDDWQSEAESYRLFAFLVRRGELAAATETLEKQESQLNEAKTRQMKLEGELEAREKDIDAISQSLKKLEEERYSSDLYQKLETLKESIDSIQKAQRDLQEKIAAATAHLQQKATLLQAAASQAQTLGQELAPRLAKVDEEGSDALYKPLRQSLLQIEKPASCLATSAAPLAADRLPSESETLAAAMADLRQSQKDFLATSALCRHRLSEHQAQTKELLDSDRQQLTELRRGIKQYPNPGLKPLRQLLIRELSARHQQEVSVWIVADELEISDPVWTDALEGYLHTQKFYLLVEPRYFNEALAIYDREKQNLRLYDIGLIDIEKLAASGPRRLPGSLAEKVHTENELLRPFIDHVLGEVIGCDKVTKLRDHRRAITAGCMLYQNFVARQLNPARYQDRYIGKSAIRAQIAALEAKIESLEAGLAFYSQALPLFAGWSDLSGFSDYEMDSLAETIGRKGQMAEMKTQEQAWQEELAGLDLSWLDKLVARIEAVKQTLAAQSREKEALQKNLYKLEAQTERLTEQDLPVSQRRCRELSDIIEQRFDAAWRQDKAEPRFQQEYASRKSGDAVRQAFYSPQNRSENQMKIKWQHVQDSRAEFNRLYQASTSVTAEHNREFSQRLARLEKEKLPDYLQQIQSAQKLAYEQFESDFLSKLKESIDDVTQTIRELNRTLKDRTWGNERFQFVVEPHPNYRRFYDMIMDELLMQGYSITYAAFREKHGDTVDELFRQILSIDEDASGDQRSELERNIQAYCNYRTYLRFDLHTIDENNEVQRLSKTLRKKSGGETQTPYYIAMLAAFVQLYRIGDRNRSCMRLIIFDEAFSKMDGERIRESIELLRRIGFQCIISAPPDKIADIAPLVDRNICVLKHQRRSFLAYFDKQTIQRIEDELGVEEDDSALPAREEGHLPS